MPKTVENPKVHVISVRLDAAEREDFERLSLIFGGSSEALRLGLKNLAATAGIDFGRGDFGGSDA